MMYEFYIFSQLYHKIIVGDDEHEPYEILFEKIVEKQQKFYNSKYCKDKTLSEYDAIVKFLEGVA